MALLEQIHRLVVQLGLVPKIIKGLPVISLLLSVIGILWIAFLPLDGQYRRTYISENALMPSQAYSYFRESEWNLLRGYRTQLSSFSQNGTIDYDSSLATIRYWLDDIGYKTSIQHSEYGDNLYAVWHAPRGDDTEAIVLGAGFYNSDGTYNIGGLSLTIALARYYYRWGIWSKNLIIVIPKDPNLALRSWVNAYHTSLDLTGGSIESAIILDYPSEADNFEYIELYYEGVNGQLPNLDLVNIAVSISEHEGPKISLQGTPMNELEVNDYWSRLRMLVKGILELALAALKKGHGNEAFSGWRIQAITLKAIGETGPHDITTFGRIPEAIFRSVNNLLEKFHQSFFFYFLLAPRNFVSIGTYLPSAALIAISFGASSLDNVLNSGFESTHLLKFLIPSSVVLITSIIVGFVISQVALHLPVAFMYLLIVGSIGASLTPLFVTISSTKESKILIRALGLLYLCSSLISLLVLNFSLTFIIGLLASPLTFVSDRINNKKKVLFLLVSNPFILALLAVSEVEGGLNSLLLNLTTSWRDFSCLTWFVISIGWLPGWLSIAYSSLIDDKSRDEKGIKKIE